jgi:hypothetical protein
LANKKAPKPEPIVLDESCCGDESCDACELFEAPAELAPESPVSPVEAPVAPERPRTHVVRPGDSYARIAQIYKPAGLSGHAYAKDLYEANAGKPLRPGAVILL